MVRFSLEKTLYGGNLTAKNRQHEQYPEGPTGKEQFYVMSKSSVTGCSISNTASPGHLLEMQNFDPSPDLLNWNLLGA